MRIAFFVRQRFHDAILRPIYDELRQHDCIFTHRFDLVVKHRPQVVVQSEGAMALRIGRLRGMLPTTLIVNTRHGLAAKNVTYQGVTLSDYTCLTSEWVREEYLRHNTQPRRAFWITGYPQLDPLFRGEPVTLPFDIRPDQQRVLIAPTYNPGLSCVPMLGENVLRGLLRSGRTVMLKPHPHTEKHFPEWFFMCRELAAREEHFHFVSNASDDLIPYLLNADVLVSDASSAALEYLVLDRPIVLVNNPTRFTDPHFDPRGLEWRWRDMGEELDDIEHLPDAIERALQNPAERSEIRLKYRQLLFGEHTDGCAAWRIARKIEELQALFETTNNSSSLGKNTPPIGRWF